MKQMTQPKGWPLMLVAILLLAAIGAKDLLIQPRTAPSDFNASRAIQRLATVIGPQVAHSVDTPANDAVRERLIAQLAAIGIPAEIHEANDCSGFPKSRAVSCSHTRNVIATLPGDLAQPALLLNSHYDSTPTGPGAADDGIGVATMLEVAALVKDAPRARSIIFLFNEGEEFGLNGASAFVDQDPLAAKVGKLINMESRGVTGPAIMFETSQPNGQAIADFAAATRRPYANSLSMEFAKLIPNSTDVVKFKPREWETLNYAITGNETRYHTPGDDIAHLDPRSVQHMGDKVLAATRRLAGTDSAPAAPKVFTDIGGWFFISMPLMIAAILFGALVIAGIALVHRRKAWPALGWSAAAFVVPVAIAALLATAIGFVRPGDYWRALPFVPTLAVAATVIAAQLWFSARFLSRFDVAQRRLAAWALILLVGGAISLAMPGAMIFFLIGPALGLIGLWWRLAAWLGALVQLLMFAELIALIEMTLIDGPAWAVAPLVALAALPFFAEVARPARWPVLAIAALALAAWVAALVIPRASADRPLAFTIDHVQDERLGEANWAISTKQAPLPATYDALAQWNAKPLPYNKRQRWQAQAPLMEGPRGQIILIADRREGDKRVIRLRLDRAGGDAILLRFDEDTPVLAMGLPGRQRIIDTKADKGPSIIRCTGRSCDGMEVEVTLGTTEPVTSMLVTTRFVPPIEAAPLIKARPANAHPQYGPDSQIRVRAIRI